MNQTWENGQKPSFRTNFAPYGPNLGLRNFFPGFYLYMLDIVASYHCMQFQGKLKNQTWKNGKKHFSGPILVPLAQICAQKCSWILPLLDVKTSKSLVLGLILAIWPKFGLPVFLFFFSKKWLHRSLDIMVNYHQILWSTIIINNIRKNLVMDRQTDEQTDRQTRVIS